MNQYRYYGDSSYYSPSWYPVGHPQPFYFLPVFNVDWNRSRRDWHSYDYWNPYGSAVNQTARRSPSSSRRSDYSERRSTRRHSPYRSEQRTPNEMDYELTNRYAVAPTVFDEESPGIDFYYPDRGTGESLSPGQQTIVNTHVIVRLPRGTIGVMMDKSSVVTRTQLKVEAGLIDTGYRGEIKIVLRNVSREQVHVLPGQAIAQMVLHEARHVRLKRVNGIDAGTHRGTRGFGRERTVKRTKREQEEEEERALHRAVKLEEEESRACGREWKRDPDAEKEFGGFGIEWKREKE